jgi:hypothetical protein
MDWMPNAVRAARVPPSAIKTVGQLTAHLCPGGASENGPLLTLWKMREPPGEGTGPTSPVHPPGLL